LTVRCYRAMAEAGRTGEARAATEKAMQLHPALSIGFIRSHFGSMPETASDSLVDSLRKAGIPEE